MNNKTEHVLTKVPEVTLIFWIIKVVATTLGETGGDAVSMSMHLRAYFLVYASDLTGIFPVLPDNMPHLLRMIEVAGVIISMLIFSFSIQPALKPDNTVHSETGTLKLENKRLIFLIVLAAVGIVIFATRAAMR
jgi:uncharacterized membrane-anchored protein